LKFDRNHREIAAYLSPFENEVSLRATDELAGWSSSPTKLSARRARERVIFRSGSRDDNVNEDNDDDDGPLLLPPTLPPAAVTAFSVASRSSSPGVASRRFCSLDATFGTSFKAVSVDIFAHET